MLAVDTEVPGLDLYHSCKPYLVTTCTDEEVQRFWEWDVDPYTRQPVIPPEDVEEIREWIVENLPGGVVFHNTKFDVKALDTIGVWEGFDLDRLWAAVDDTLLAGHLLASNQPHNLTDMTSHYLGVNISGLEEAVRDCVQECRRLVRSKTLHDRLGEWKIAKKHQESDPSITEKAWPADMWLPRAVARELGHREPAGWCDHVWLPSLLCKRCKGHRYWLVVQEYANADSSVTVKLWERLQRELQGRQLWKIYQHRRQLLPIAYSMEERGITVNAEALGRLQGEYQEEADKCGNLCKAIASTYGYNLTLPQGSSNNKSLLEFCFGTKPPVLKKKKVGKAGNKKNSKNSQPDAEPAEPWQRTPYLDLPVLERTDTGAPSLNKDVVEKYTLTLEPNSKQHVFITNLSRKRKRDTSLSYMAAYKRFWLPLHGEDGWYILHPSLNITGTATTRWSCERPNEQNISKKGIEARCPKCKGAGCEYCGDSGWVSYNLRYAFGPAPGREWWSCDAKNIELRIPAYESGEQELINLFERPDEPPYYGSTHLLNFHTVYPDIWEDELSTVCDSKNCCKGAVVDLTRIGPHCKKKFADTWYQYCKNGGFAVQYGAIDRIDVEGTADRAFHRRGSHARLKARFSRLEAHNQRCIRQAEKHGYVETIPSKGIDPDRGYPLLCTRTENGRILPTVPLNYRTQGSACVWMAQAMVRCYDRLTSWNRGGFDGHIIAQVHDELLFDLPRHGDPRKDFEKEKTGKPYFRTSNLWRMRELQRLMEKGGEEINIPTPTSCEYHETSWAEGVTM